MGKEAKDDSVTWRRIFIEIALRAIRRIHLDYGMWGLGQQLKNKSDLEKINQGPGIEIALETAVCSAITQEFINSRFTNGVYLKEETRHYEIDREVKFEKGKKNIIIDIFIDRFQTNSIEEKYFRYPALIQAKRAHYFIPNISTGERENKEHNYDKIRDDIDGLKKLKSFQKLVSYEIKRKKYKNNLHGAFLYTLFGGTETENKETDSNANEKISLKDRVLSEIKKNVNEHTINYKKDFEIKWMPLRWSNTPEVEEWLWVALIEIKPFKNPPLAKNKKKEDIRKNWFQIPLASTPIV